MVNVYIFGIIIGKLYYEKKLYSIILLKVNKNLEVDFYYTILPFGLVIHLRVEGDKESSLDVKKIV